MDSDLVKSSSSSSSSSSSASAPSRRWTYDVFLSFHGKDTRNNFTDHLYAALDRAGIYAFKDDEKLRRGTSIYPELVKAIQESIIVVVVFSKNYAKSCWCLEELAKIIECRHLMGQTVLPVFYHVDPSDVRGQKGSFQAAFEKHEVKLAYDMEKVKKWREALMTAASLSGWHVTRTASGRESECIKQIVRNILSYMESRNCPDNLIGMVSRVQHVKSLLGKGTDDVCMIGIWGMGGIGKTTIARTVYRQVSYEFEGSSFLEGVRENSSDKKGLKKLQEKLLSEILMEKCFELKDCDDGICQIQRRLCRKKVLIVLDDVDRMEQLEFLVGSHDWFGLGSRIMITTRDEHLLSYAQEKYAPELLKENEAMQLFSRYAFKSNFPPKAYEDVSGVVVSHTGYLPLALKVLGSHFYGRNLVFWQSALNVLSKVPHKEILEILKISYDGLNILEKKIFLHIACYFNGWERDYVIGLLECCGFEAVSVITLLIEKSLLTVSQVYRHMHLHMHDLIQDLGRFVASECYPYNMVWSPDEIKEVITASDRWVCWSLNPCQSLIITKDMATLVDVELYGGIEQLHIENKVILTNLKYMDVSYSKSITTSPNVSGIPYLEYLNLSQCDSMVELHQSVMLHERIIHLDLGGCDCLYILPHSIKMKSLQILILYACENLERFPEISKETRRLLVLDMNRCIGIRELPSSFRLLTCLTILTLSEDHHADIMYSMGMAKRCLKIFTHLRSLRVLDLQNNNFVEEDFPMDLQNAWPYLEELDLSFNVMTRLPASISHLSNLKYLNLTCCGNLKELPDLPSLIQVLKAHGCRSLQKIGDLSTKYKWLFQVSFSYCRMLLKDKETRIFVANMLMQSFIHKCAAVNHRLSIVVPGRKIPNWFNNQSLGNTITVDLAQNQIAKMTGLAICCIIGPSYGTHRFPKLLIKFKASSGEKKIDLPPCGTRGKHVWIGYMSTNFLGIHGYEFNDLILELSTFCSIMKCGACVVYKDDIKSMTSSWSWMQDYDELEEVDRHNPSGKRLPNGRWSFPTFSIERDATRHSNKVKVSGLAL